ncbi:MAG: hypothetical protein LBL33_10790 [Tannerella sp.]|jgi:hypothetical protein|nr:hypothetical protein [Tannerella sp.]
MKKMELSADIECENDVKEQVLDAGTIEIPEEKENTLTQKTDAQNLQKWINSIPVGEYRKKIDDVIAGCKIPRSTFYNWKFGLCRIPELHKDKIEEIAGCKIFVR